MNIEELGLELVDKIDSKSKAIRELTADILESLLAIRINSREMSYLKYLHEKIIKIQEEHGCNDEDVIL